MSIDLVSISALIAPILLFIGTAWKVIEDRSDLKRLERLTSIYASMPGQNQAKTDVAKSVEYLAGKVRKRESPPSGLVLVRNTATVFTVAAVVAIVTFLPPFQQFPHPGEASFIMLYALAGMLLISVTVAYMSVLIQLLWPAFSRLIQDIKARRKP